MGTDAYSLIEQGKVDTLLQASPRDRRAIFEEAAGISRFKAKKVETQRRLERVEQNLERLSDIVDEVESQLRSVRNQASKARRYKEYTDRLKELRTHVGLADWRRLSHDLEELETKLRDERVRAEQIAGDAERARIAAGTVDQEGQQLETELHEVEATAAQVQQELTGHQSTISYEYQRLDELAHEIQRYPPAVAGDDDAGRRSRACNCSRYSSQLATAQAEEHSIRARRDAEQVALDGHQRATGEPSAAARRAARGTRPPTAGFA